MKINDPSKYHGKPNLSSKQEDGHNSATKRIRKQGSQFTLLSFYCEKMVESFKYKVK